MATELMMEMVLMEQMVLMERTEQMEQMVLMHLVGTEERNPIIKYEKCQ
jgi:hypothetical protein